MPRVIIEECNGHLRRFHIFHHSNGSKWKWYSFLPFKPKFNVKFTVNAKCFIHWIHLIFFFFMARQQLLINLFFVASVDCYMELGEGEKIES